MKKRWSVMVSSILALSLVAAGCSSGNGTTGNNTKDSAAGKDNAVQTKPVKILMTEPRESNQEDLDKVKKYIEEKSGVKFEVKNIKSSGDYDKQLNVSLASGEDIDVVLLNSQDNYRMLTEKNAAMDIKAVVDKYGTNLKKQYPEDIWKAVTDKNGKVLGIPRISNLSADSVVIRKDWREKLGMQPIKTLDDFEKYLRAVRDNDLDGNGVKDTIPLLSYSSKNDYMGFDNTLLYLFTETNPNGNYLDDKGNVTPVVMHPQYKAFLGTLARWHKEGILYPDIYSIKKNQAEDLIINNRVGAFAAWYSDHARPLEKLKAKVPQADYEYVQFKTLKGNDAKWINKIAYSQRAVILSTSKNAEFAVKLFDWMLTSPENYFSTKWGIPGEYWDWVDKNQGIVKRLKGKDNPEKSYNNTLSMMFYGPWDFRSNDPGFVDKRYNDAKDYFQERKDLFLPAPDWFVNYSFKGTPVYSSQQDADTLILENKVKIIIGEKPVDEWDKAIEQYKKIYGNSYVEVATKQFKEYKK